MFRSKIAMEDEAILKSGVMLRVVLEITWRLRVGSQAAKSSTLVNISMYKLLRSLHRLWISDKYPILSAIFLASVIFHGNVLSIHDLIS